jgi:hypothetical protein
MGTALATVRLIYAKVVSIVLMLFAVPLWTVLVGALYSLRTRTEPAQSSI